MHESFSVSHEIIAALNHSEPVVALESSVIAQGLPKGENIKAARLMQEAVRENGAVPAIIGILDGVITVGLSEEQIQRLAEEPAKKVAARDLPYVVFKKYSGGTTVSATIRIASAAGLSVMATGGIGGVHRGYSQSLDVSEDLWEMARTPMTVVCSGAKCVLDIPATLEWLETYSIPVYGYQTEDFPAFYSRTTGLPIPAIDSSDEYSELMTLCRAELGLRSSVIVAVPVPEDSEVVVENEINIATKEALEQGITGKRLTPFLLNRLAELTEGRTIESNLALLENNARIAAQLAGASVKSDTRKCGFSV